jgi:hypothetical protein
MQLFRNGTAAQSDSLTPTSITRFWVIVGLIALLAFGLRLSQIGHGLPDVQISDENSDLSTTARLLTGELPQPSVRYSRTIISNLELIGFAGIYVQHFFATGDPSFNSFRDLYLSERGRFTYVSRLLVVLVSVMALCFLADALRRAASLHAGILGALLTSVFYFWDLHSIYATPDSLVASAVVFFTWSAIYVLQHGTRRAYMLAGLALAFVMLTKLSALPIGVVLLLAHAYRAWNAGRAKGFVRRLVVSDRLFLAAAATAFGNIALNPVAFFRLNDLVYEITSLVGYGFSGNNAASGAQVSSLLDRLGMIVQKTDTLVNYYVGLPLTACLIVGIALVFVQHRQTQSLILVAGLMLWLAIASQVMYWFYSKPYYWMPAVPPIIMLCSIGLAWLLSFVRKRGPLPFAAACVLVAALIVNEASLTLNVASIMGREYTFAQAQQYIYRNWPRSSSILMGPNISWSVPLQRDEESILRARKLGAPGLQTWAWWLSQPSEARRFEYNIYGPEMESAIQTYADVRKLILDERIQYVIDVDQCGGEDKRPDATSPLEFPPLNDEIRRGLRLVEVFSPFQEGQYCSSPIYERTTIKGRPDVAHFYRPGAIVRLYEVDFEALRALTPSLPPSKSRAGSGWAARPAVAYAQNRLAAPVPPR